MTYFTPFSHAPGQGFHEHHSGWTNKRLATYSSYLTAIDPIIVKKSHNQENPLEALGGFGAASLGGLGGEGALGAGGAT